LLVSSARAGSMTAGRTYECLLRGRKERDGDSLVQAHTPVEGRRLLGLAVGKPRASGHVLREGADRGAIDAIACEVCWAGSP